MIRRRRSKNILIVSLLCSVLMMVVAYAAFSAALNINGTANVSSNWDVEILSVTPDKTATNSGTSQNPNYTTAGDITHSISGGGLTANFDTALVKPGDLVTYTIVVKNKGTIDAVLTSVTKTNTNNPAITFAVNGLIEGESLAAGASKTFTAVVGYASSTTSQPNNTDSNLSLTLNYAQTGTTVSTNKVYAFNESSITVGTSTLSNVGTTYSSCAATGHNVCSRYTITNNVVTGSEVCFIKNSVEYCLTTSIDECQQQQGSCTVTSKPVYDTNVSILQTAFPESGACNYGSAFSCYYTSWIVYNADKGDILVFDGTDTCWSSGITKVACTVGFPD